MRGMLGLMTCEHDLAMRVNSENKMRLTGKQDGFRIAKSEGWTTVTGRATLPNVRQALMEVLALRIANDPAYRERISRTTREALGDDVEVSISNGLAWRAQAQQ